MTQWGRGERKAILDVSAASGRCGVPLGGNWHEPDCDDHEAIPTRAKLEDQDGGSEHGPGQWENRENRHSEQFFLETQPEADGDVNKPCFRMPPSFTTTTTEMPADLRLRRRDQLHDQRQLRRHSGKPENLTVT